MGRSRASSSASPSSGASEAGTLSALATLDQVQPIRGEAFRAQALALVGYYEDGDGVQYILSMDGSLSMQAPEGKSLQGWYSVDETEMVHFYVGVEGPVASFRVDPQGSLYTRGQELTRLEFACIW